MHAPADGSQVRVERAASETTVSLPGDWDLCEAPRLRETLDRVDATQRVIFDFSQTSYIDSSAMRVLVEFKKRSMQLNGTTEARYGDNDRTAKLLAISGLSTLFSPQHDRC